MSNTAWDAELGCPNGETSPSGNTPYTATVFATSAPTVTSGEAATITCQGIAGSIDNSTAGGSTSTGGNGDNNYIRVVQPNIVYSIDESISGYLINTVIVSGNPGEDKIGFSNTTPTAPGQLFINTGSATGAGDYYYLFTQQLANSGSIRLVGAAGGDRTFSGLSVSEGVGFITVTYDTVTVGNATAYVRDESATTFDVNADWYEYTIPRGYNRIAIQNLSDDTTTPFILRADSTLDVGDNAVLEVELIAGSSRTFYGYFYNVGHNSSSFYNNAGGQILADSDTTSVFQVMYWESGSSANNGLVPLTAQNVNP